MPRRRQTQKGAATTSPTVALQQPDRSGPDPSRRTLLDIAEDRGLLKEGNGDADAGDDAGADDELDAPIARFGEAVLWTVSLAMLHFTFDVLAQHQYAVEMQWPSLIMRSVQAFGVILILFYILHPHPSPPVFSVRIPPRYKSMLHQLLFFTGSVSAGCYLIYITNEHGSYHVMKRSPPVGCLWVWSVIELDLRWALISVLCCIAYMWQGGYSYI